MSVRTRLEKCFRIPSSGMGEYFANSLAIMPLSTVTSTPPRSEIIVLILIVIPAEPLTYIVSVASVNALNEFYPCISSCRDVVFAFHVAEHASSYELKHRVVRCRQLCNEVVRAELL